MFLLALQFRFSFLSGVDSQLGISALHIWKFPCAFFSSLFVSYQCRYCDEVSAIQTELFCREHGVWKMPLLFVKGPNLLKFPPAGFVHRSMQTQAHVWIWTLPEKNEKQLQCELSFQIPGCDVNGKNRKNNSHRKSQGWMKQTISSTFFLFGFFQTGPDCEKSAYWTQMRDVHLGLNYAQWCQFVGLRRDIVGSADWWA